MSPWQLSRVNLVPLFLGLVFALGLTVCFVVAVLRGDVSPYMPFISETGGKFPEAGLFSIFLYLSSTVGLSTALVRLMLVSEMNRGLDRTLDVLNRVSAAVIFIALMGMVVVAAFPMTSIMTAHTVGADVLFIGGIVYGALQTWLSYRMSPYYNGLAICRVRLAITVVGAVALVSMLILAPMAIGQWSTADHNHWTGSKTPNDQGFGMLVASSVAEWVMALSFLAFYFTFVREFSKVAIHVRLQPLVQHFDDDPLADADAVVATERTPIVM